MERRHKFFLKKCLFCLPLNSAAIERHLEKGTRSKFDSQVLCPWAIENVVANDEVTVNSAVDVETMCVHSFVERLTSYNPRKTSRR